jgi:hypothetical protein
MVVRIASTSREGSGARAGRMGRKGRKRDEKRAEVAVAVAVPFLALDGGVLTVCVELRAEEGRKEGKGESDVASGTERRWMFHLPLP